MSTNPKSAVIRPLLESDSAEWQTLFKAYGKFYKLDVTDQALEQAWSWVFNDQEDFWCAVAETDEGIIGFTQYQLMHRSLSGGKVVYLSDLYVIPETRAAGIGRALIDHVFEFARTRHIENVCWLTQDFNYPARRLYDTYQPKSDFILYSIPVE